MPHTAFSFPPQPTSPIFSPPSQPSLSLSSPSSLPYVSLLQFLSLYWLEHQLVQHEQGEFKDSYQKHWCVANKIFFACPLPKYSAIPRSLSLLPPTSLTHSPRLYCGHPLENLGFDMSSLVRRFIITMPDQPALVVTTCSSTCSPPDRRTFARLVITCTPQSLPGSSSYPHRRPSRSLSIIVWRTFCPHRGSSSRVRA